jgi:hypothetical protein
MALIDFCGSARSRRPGRRGVRIELNLVEDRTREAVALSAETTRQLLKTP